MFLNTNLLSMDLNTKTVEELATHGSKMVITVLVKSLITGMEITIIIILRSEWKETAI